MTNPNISIVVPVYNVEKYLKKCIDSILNQTYRDFEVILVNDGSTDKSGLICDEYRSRYENIQVIHKKNGGLSSARDAAISLVKGKYLMFIDSDDWIEQNTLEVLNKEVASKNYDIIVFGMILDFYIDKHRCEKVSLPSKSYDSIELYLKEFDKYRSSGLFGYVWNKLYKTEIIKTNKLEFGEYIFPEDLYFNFKVLPYCKHIKVIDSVLYHYVHRNRETLSKSKRDVWATSNQIYDNTVEFLKANNSYEVNKEYISNVYLQAISHYILKDVLKNKNKIKNIKNLYNNDKVKYAAKYANPKPIFYKIMHKLIKLRFPIITIIFLKIYAFCRDKNS